MLYYILSTNNDRNNRACDQVTEDEIGDQMAYGIPWDDWCSVINAMLQSVLLSLAALHGSWICWIYVHNNLIRFSALLVGRTVAPSLEKE